MSEAIVRVTSEEYEGISSEILFFDFIDNPKCFDAHLINDELADLKAKLKIAEEFIEKVWKWECDCYPPDCDCIWKVVDGACQTLKQIRGEEG